MRDLSLSHEEFIMWPRLHEPVAILFTNVIFLAVAGGYRTFEQVVVLPDAEGRTSLKAQKKPPNEEKVNLSNV